MTRQQQGDFLWVPLLPFLYLFTYLFYARFKPVSRRSPLLMGPLLLFGVQTIFATADIGYHLFSYRQLPFAVIDTLQLFFLFGFVVTGALILMEQQAMQRRLADAVNRDRLTGLLRRTGFQQAEATFPRPAVLAVLDVDQLKGINDRHGHAEGDRYLLNLAQALQQAMPPNTVLGRWGEDEFTLLASGTDEQAVHTLLSGLRVPPPPESAATHALSPTFSFGTSVLEPGQPFEQTFALADYHMYLHKAQKPEPEDTRLYRCFEQFEPLRTPDEMIRTAVKLAHDLLEFDYTLYCMVGATGQPLPIIHALSQPGSHVVEFGVGQTVPWRHLVNEVVTERRTVVSLNFQSDPQALATLNSLGVKTFILVPVLQEQRVTGLLIFLHLRTWKPVPRETQRTAELIALRLGQALQHQQLAEAARLTIEGGLLSLGIALEARDLETNGHTQRVVRLATALGTAARLGDETLAVLQQGASLHDIGKLTVPDAVLLKPGALDAEEWNVMKSHVTSGVDIARRLPGLPSGVLDVIGAHHERWDGRGYPLGLVGEEIPLLARIFSLCDVYDALTNERPYKRAWSDEDARAELAAQAGKQFDPHLTALFLALDLQGVKASA